MAPLKSCCKFKEFFDCVTEILNPQQNEDFFRNWLLLNSFNYRLKVSLVTKNLSRIIFQVCLAPGWVLTCCASLKQHSKKLLNFGLVYFIWWFSFFTIFKKKILMSSSKGCCPRRHGQSSCLWTNYTRGPGFDSSSGQMVFLLGHRR